MSVIDPDDYQSPIPEVHKVVMAYIATVSECLGPPAFPVVPIRMHKELKWAAVWFIDGRNNNMSVVRTVFGVFEVYLHTHKDPFEMTFNTRSPEVLKTYLDRFTPDHWKAQD